MISFRDMLHIDYSECNMGASNLILALFRIFSPPISGNKCFDTGFAK